MDKTSPRPRVFTIPQVAEDLQVSTRTVRRWIAVRDLTSYRLGKHCASLNRICVPS